MNDDLSQLIIDRLDRIETKQDVQGEKISGLQVTLAAHCAGPEAVERKEAHSFDRFASYGGLLAGVGAMCAIIFKR